MKATGADGNAERLAGDAGIAGVADGDTGSLADLNAGSATATSFENDWYPIIRVSRASNRHGARGGNEDLGKRNAALDPRSSAAPPQAASAARIR
ncbi:hypothetical protein, partial [Nocardia xishanensis]